MAGCALVPRVVSLALTTGVLWRLPTARHFTRKENALLDPQNILMLKHLCSISTYHTM